jgi:hypothetical protein
VQDNLATLYGAIDDGALAIRLPAFVRKELEAYLDCGLLCRGFAHVLCEGCKEKRLVAFGCGGRGFCPSCLGRRMSQAALNLTQCVLPPAPLRQWVLTFPFAWHARLGFDAPLFGALTRVFVRTVLAFHAERMKREGVNGGQSGAVVVLQRTSSDLRLQPHLHVVFLDGVYRAQGDQALWYALPRVSTQEIAGVLDKAVRRIVRHLSRRGLLGDSDGANGEPEPEGHAGLCAAAASGASPPAGPELRRRLAAVGSDSVRMGKALCASLQGFTLHAATRVGAMDTQGREGLLKYILRPPIAQERVTQGPDGLVRIALKRPFADGTLAVDLDPLSLLCRLAATVPAPRTHTVRYAGVLGSASKLRARIVPTPPPTPPADDTKQSAKGGGKRSGCRYRSWAELLHTLGIDGLQCPKCNGPMRVLSLVRETGEVRRFLRAMGEPTEPPERAAARGPPYWASRVLRVRSGAQPAQASLRA